jgi:hypothetical protein
VLHGLSTMPWRTGAADRRGGVGRAPEERSGPGGHRIASVAGAGLDVLVRQAAVVAQADPDPGVFQISRVGSWRNRDMRDVRVHLGAGAGAVRDQSGEDQELAAVTSLLHRGFDHGGGTSASSEAEKDTLGAAA